ncbi:MAG: SGNH/GDSL hydrolase family protein [Devosia sp.]
MKTILCFGDSLTYGASPIKNGPRHAYEDRWPTALEAGLGGKARCIAEGLGGRTTVHDDWAGEGDRNGARILPTLLSSHSPLDMVIIMLGTNDIKPFLGRTALEASFGMRRLAQIVRGHAAVLKGTAPHIVFVAPPVTVQQTANDDMEQHFGGHAAALAASSGFAAAYQRRAEEEEALFFDAGAVAKTDPRDGIHLDQANTRAIGLGLVPLVKSIFGL